MSDIANHLSSITQTFERMRSGEKLEFLSVVGEYHQAGLFAGSGADENAATDAVIRSVMSAGVVAVIPKVLRKAELIQKKINARRKALIPKLKKIISDLDAEAAYISKIVNEFGGQTKAVTIISDIAEQGRAFSVALETLSTSLDQPIKADKVNHLANLFVKSLRGEWFGLTGVAAPKDGGVKLRRLAAAVWADFDMPRDPSFQDENLDRWFARRFSETAD